MKIVFISGHEFAGNNNNGGKQGSRKLYDLWAKTVGKKNVYVIMFSNKEYSTDIENIKYFRTHHNRVEQMKNACFLRNGYDYHVEKRVKKYIESLEPDIIYFDHSNVGRLLHGLNIPFRTKVFVFMHNIEHDYVWNKVKNESVFYLIPFFSYWKNEKYIVKHADVVMNLNKRDAKRLKEVYKRESDYLIPVSYYDSFDEQKIIKSSKKPYKLLFVGAYSGPNVQGIEWFIKNVLGQLKDYELLIVGMNMEKLRKRVSNPNVHVIGTVDDISCYYYNADIVVIPLLYGAGMKTKTAEAMMYGKIIVGSDEALEGYITDTDNIYHANSSDEYVNIINQIKVPQKYCKNVRDIYLENYCTNVLEERFVEFIDEYTCKEE